MTSEIGLAGPGKLVASSEGAYYEILSPQMDRIYAESAMISRRMATTNADSRSHSQPNTPPWEEVPGDTSNRHQ